MPRANRHYIPGHVWNITHRCHKKEFLLKFAKDRLRYLYWVFEARKRFGLCVLNYTVTSNHVHLLVKDIGGKDVIPKSIQLIAGRTGQEFNRRKNRKGAFWEDRYHATAVETGRHLIQCLIYIDLNMIRAGVVRHPLEWGFGGYAEIQSPKRRYSLIDYPELRTLLNFSSMDVLAGACREWIDEALKAGSHFRDEKWTRSIAVGTEAFVKNTRQNLGFKAAGHDITGGNGNFELREFEAPYMGILGYEKVDLTPENEYFWNK